MTKRIHELLDFNSWLFFLVLVVFYLVIRYLTDRLIVEAIPDSDTLEEAGQLTYFFLFRTLGYLWTPFELLFKFTVTTFLIWIGSFTIGFKVSFKKIWKIVLTAEIILLLSEFVRFLAYLVKGNAASYLEIAENRPLSLVNLIGYEQIADPFRYPLGTINLFEVAYWLLLILGFHAYSQASIRQSTYVILLSYVLPLFAWLGWYILVYR